MAITNTRILLLQNIFLKLDFIVFCAGLVSRSFRNHEDINEMKNGIIVRKTSTSYEYLTKNVDDAEAIKNPAVLSPLYTLNAFADFFSSTEEYMKAESHPEIPEKESAAVIVCSKNSKNE